MGIETVKKYFAGAVEEASPKPNFMLQFFAGTPWTFNDRFIELNKSFIKAKAAPYVNPYVNGKKIEKEFEEPQWGLKLVPMTRLKMFMIHSKNPNGD